MEEKKENTLSDKNFRAMLKYLENILLIYFKLSERISQRLLIFFLLSFEVEFYWILCKRILRCRLSRSSCETEAITFLNLFQISIVYLSGFLVFHKGLPQFFISSLFKYRFTYLLFLSCK
jgi:hypothetical protein